MAQFHKLEKYSESTDLCQNSSSPLYGIVRKAAFFILKWYESPPQFNQLFFVSLPSYLEIVIDIHYNFLFRVMLLTDKQIDKQTNKPTPAI